MNPNRSSPITERVAIGNKVFNHRKYSNKAMLGILHKEFNE